MKFEAMKTKMRDKMKEDLENLGRKYTEATRGHSGDREVEEGVKKRPQRGSDCSCSSQNGHGDAEAADWCNCQR